MGMRSGELVMRVRAVPSEGKANREATRFVASIFSVPLSSVQLVSGEKSRHKKFEIVGLGSDEVRAKLNQVVSQNPFQLR